jgi:ribosomal protein S18 acetylase RimI-like enzyme
MRPARREDLPEIIDIWTDAFATDPFLRWIQPDDDGWPKFANEWYGLIGGLGFEAGNTYIDEAGRGAIAWLPPDFSLMDTGDFDRAMDILHRHVGAAHADEVRQTILSARQHELASPHWVLQYIGVRADARGAGIGRELAAPQVERCTVEGSPAWLISSNAANVSFYERLGFEVMGEVWTPDRKACLRPMKREP